MMDEKNHSVSDEDLVKRFQETIGKEKKDMFAELYRRHERKLRWFLMRLTENEKLANDLTQEAFCKALRNLDEFKAQSSFKTWLYRIATNTWKNHLKKHRPETGLPEKQTSAESKQPDERVEEQEDIEAVRESIEMLPAKYRAPLLLVRFEGMQYQEAATVLGISTDSLRMKLYRARKKLKTFLEENFN